MFRLLFSITRHPVGLAGAALTTASGIMFVVLLGIEAVGFHGTPYLGILTFLVLPGVFIAGLLLIPIGVVLDRRRRRRAAKAEMASGKFPVVDLNRDTVRRNVLILLGATVFNISLLAVATYKGVELMETTAFCGATCHRVMAPEFTTFQGSPHGRVRCVECHIGPGADWFVKSKLSGSWQVIATSLDLYPRPIPVPVHNLRPARETCEQCHWPEKFIGDKLKVITRYDEDEANTPLKTVLLLRVGGVQGRQSHGIHWHVDPRHQIRYRSDETRETIHVVEMAGSDGTVRMFNGATAPSEKVGAMSHEAQWRVMDCIDCHNRPSHIFRLPGPEIDDAMALGDISASLPYLKREGLRVLQEGYSSHDEARQAIPEAIRAFYEDNYPEVMTTQADDVETAGRVLVEIFTRNVHPKMNITWGTYPNHIGHERFPGCFRCHNDEHQAEDGTVISQDCDTCHTILAYEEHDPEILTQLRP